MDDDGEAGDGTWVSGLLAFGPLAVALVKMRPRR